MVYLDHNATTPIHPAVLEAFLPFYGEKFGNPSSVHWAGRKVKGAVDEAREQVAATVNCDPGEVVFTSCGSEADNMAIKGVAAALHHKGNHIITARTEHPAVVNSCLYLEQSGCRITWLPVDADGLISLESLEAAISDQTVLVALMLANNETGTILPVAEIGAQVARHRIYFHCDAVQALGKVPIDFKASQATFLALSGHKIGAPKGIGALVVRKGAKLHPLLHGGSQERNRRAGTENVAGIVAFGKACDLARESLGSEPDRLRRLRDRLESGITNTISDVRVNGHPQFRLPNTSNLSFKGVAADSLLFNLDLEGVAASSGSACSSGTLKASSVLTAMGVEPTYARGAVRFSLGLQTTEADIEYVLSVLPGIVDRLRRD